MDITGIASGAYGLGGGSGAASQELGKDSFMRLLVSQLQNQDPINPQSNEDFIAQLAQFSSLEQMENLNDAFLGMAAMQQSTALIGQLEAASSLIGKSVQYYDPQTGELASGSIDSVRLEDSVAMLNIDGQSVPLSYLHEINGEPSDPPTGDDGGETDEGDQDQEA